MKEIIKNENIWYFNLDCLDSHIKEIKLLKENKYAKVEI
jgi:hypothetical protein